MSLKLIKNIVQYTFLVCKPHGIFLKISMEIPVVFFPLAYWKWLKVLAVIHWTAQGWTVPFPNIVKKIAPNILIAAEM